MDNFSNNRIINRVVDQLSLCQQHDVLRSEENVSLYKYQHLGVLVLMCPITICRMSFIVTDVMVTITKY